MHINQIQTPAILLDLDIMEKNIQTYADIAKKHNKQIWPMVKTHKSTMLAELQESYGCTGFLCGTLDEAEALCNKGKKNIMYAYPVATNVSIQRVITLVQKCNFIIRIDGEEAASYINEKAREANVVIPYTVIVDSGLHRFGVAPDKAVSLVNTLQRYESLSFKGISTHPGHVYSACTHDEIEAYCQDEEHALEIAAKSLSQVGYTVDIISSGSTPTFRGSIGSSYIGIYHPGNYIFNDSIQLSTQTATEEECALYVLASVISHPAEDIFICDAGTKCLGLDQGAHGNSSIRGYGTVKGHPELCIYGLSEEVGKIKVDGKTNLKVGDKICIIPNHSCSSANFTNYYIGVRNEQVEKWIEVDIRGNSTKKIVV